MSSVSALVDLACSRCATGHDADSMQRTCTRCGGPLYARYEIDRTSIPWHAADFGRRTGGLWRYAELLPVRQPQHRIHLGEGSTPLLALQRLGSEIRLEALEAKDEGLNPTGSFKARGLCLAVSRAWELGARVLSIPTAGNAGSALAAYCARAGLEARIYVPVETPGEFLLEYRDLGAVVVTVEGTIADAGARMAADAQPDWFPVSTLQEPYRLEGKKTMGFELAEQGGWSLPDVIVYPTGGGTGFAGNVEGFRRARTTGAAGLRAPPHDRGSGRGLCPHRQGFRGRSRDRRAVAGGVYAGQWSARATRLRRSGDPRGPASLRRHRDRRRGRGHG